MNWFLGAALACALLYAALLWVLFELSHLGW